MNGISILFISLMLAGCNAGRQISTGDPGTVRETVISNQEGQGQEITVDFHKGKSFYYPLMAIWLEDSDGNYIQTLYVARSVATGTFRYGVISNGKWIMAPKRAPQTLPYWAHKRGIKASDGLYMPEPQNPVPDSYTGATPVKEFTLKTKSDRYLNTGFNVMMEINQNWDWNKYWTNDKYPDDENYKMSCQPALVYRAEIRPGSEGKRFRMLPVGHSHYSGKTGDLFTDLSTLTTALSIADSVLVIVR